MLFLHHLVLPKKIFQSSGENTLSTIWPTDTSILICKLNPLKGVKMHELLTICSFFLCVNTALRVTDAHLLKVPDKNIFSVPNKI